MIIITGAAGFIGSHIADFYADRGESLLLVDHPQHFRDRGYFDGTKISLWDWATGQESKTSRFKMIDRAYFPKVLEKIAPAAPSGNPNEARKAKESIIIPEGERIESVIHIGACTNTAEMRKDFLNQWNVDYTKSIWNWCAQHKVPLVYASSAATYGAGEAGFSDSWETTALLKPLNPYGQSKQDFDLWAHAESQKGNAPPKWAGLKFFNVYGPREGHKGQMASAVLHSYRQILRTGSCKLFRSHNPKVRDGEQCRDFIHVSDIVKLVDFFRKNSPTSGLYNCGTGKGRTFHALMEALFRSLKKPPQIDWIDTPEKYRKAYQYFTEADMSQTRAAGYAPHFLTLEEGVSAYVQWLLKHEVPVQGLH